MKLDLIQDKKQFEHFCKWVARENFGPNVFLYSKYYQNGIDIYWTDKGKYHVIQCKQRTNADPSELITSLESDFSQAQKYFNKNLGQFVFATTASLTVVEARIQRKNGAVESVIDVCNRLSTEYNVTVVTWHWNYLEERVLESPFLLKHLLNREAGADLIHDGFIESHFLKYDKIGEKQIKLEYYGGQEEIQWFGVLKKLDVKRHVYANVVAGIASSFERNDPVDSVIRGEGGSGKSVFLRRLAIDLRKEYTVYWLGNNIEAFIRNELTYDVGKHSESKYIIILEDWYRNIESTSNKVIANELLNKIKTLPNARLIIGDRKGKRKIYDDYVDSGRIYDLHNTENARLVSAIFKKMPDWSHLISDDELNDIANATLFIVLFVFCYGEAGDKRSLTNRYRRIFKSDYNKFLERDDPFEKGIANVLYLYATLYKNYGVVLKLQPFVNLISYYTNCSVPLKYQDNLTRLFTDLPLLKKYLHIREVSSNKFETFKKVRFHHDTMAEQGWSNKHDLVEIEFNENIIIDVIRVLKEANLYYDLSFFFYRLSKRPGEKGKSAAREYLKLDKSYEWHNPFCFCLELIKGEQLATDIATEFLKTSRPYERKEAFNKSLEILKGEELAEKKAIEFLNTDNPYENEDVFIKCLYILKEHDISMQFAELYLNKYIQDEMDFFPGAFCIALEIIGEHDLTKKAAKKYLNTSNPKKLQRPFNKCIKVLREDARDYAIDIFKNFATEPNWNPVYESLKIFGNNPQFQSLVQEVVQAVIKNKSTDWFKYREILKIPLFSLSTWVEEAENCIANWETLVGAKRNYLLSITYSYRNFPDRLADMSIGIVRNWNKELSVKTKHKAYFTRCLANINVTGNEILKEEVIQICKDILAHHERRMVELTSDLEVWIKKIAISGEFPRWRYEEPENPSVTQDEQEFEAGTGHTADGADLPPV